MEWISVKESLPKKGVKVRCLLSSHISADVNERQLYRMRHSGKWNDYDHLVTHWLPLTEPADKVFSEFIRRRYAVNSFVSCFICGTRIHWKRAHCGHLIDRDQMPTRYDEMNCNAICQYCNCVDPLHKTRYYNAMRDAYGVMAITQLIAKSKSLQKFMRHELIEIIDTYKQKLKEL